MGIYRGHANLDLSYSNTHDRHSYSHFELASPVLMEAASSSLLREVGPDEVFNLPLYEHHLVIDIRPSQKYSQGHMATAVSFPRPPLELAHVLA